MPDTNLPSRLNPRYLAFKYAGSCFFLVSLGLALGTTWRCLFQPTRYRSQAEVAFAVSPPELADRFDWDGAAERWRAVLASPEDQALLTANLRRMVKLSATRGLNPDTERLGMELSLFEPVRRYSDLLLDVRLPSWLIRPAEIGRGDIAANMDPQSLAAVASDLDPPSGATGWDFSFFDADREGDGGHHVIVNPGPDERHFRVFYLLHELLAGRPAASPREAWRTAAREVSARLDREAGFAGGGGFGRRARRELMLEIAAIPALLANGLYETSLWTADASSGRFPRTRIWTENFALAAERRGRETGTLSAGMAIDLHPLLFPRDTVLTRITPLGAVTLLAYVSAVENDAPPEAATPPVAPPPSPGAPSEPAIAIVRVAPAVPVETADNGVEARRKDRILVLEELLRRARLDRDAALRRLETARETERNLTLEALSARDRSDRLGERYHEAAAETGAGEAGLATIETARLSLARDMVMERLANLRQTCTEEHPFVREARRELAAIEELLANAGATDNAEKIAEARDVRLSRMRIDWDRAKTIATTLDARRRQLYDATEAALGAVADAEDRITSTEAELARVRSESTPTVVQAPAPVPPPAREPDSRLWPEKPAPAAFAEAAAPRTAVTPVAVFPDAPARVSTTRMPPPWDMPIIGAVFGLCLALLRMLYGELAGGRFANAFEARHMVKLPLLVALPAYDAGSFRAAAGGMRGEIFGTRPGRMTFIPLPVDFAEPKPEARRGRARPVRRLPRVGAWISGALLLVLAGAIVFFSLRGFARPPVAFRGEMTVPGTGDFDLPDSPGAHERGNSP